MDALAERLAGSLAELPGTARFLATRGPVVLAAAAAVFFARNFGPVAFLRREIVRAIGVIVASILVVMVIFSALQIVLRNAFDSGLLWIDPLLRHLVLLVAFAGAILATGLKRHVQINVLGRLVKGEGAKWVGAVIALLSGTICLALVHASLSLLRDELEFGAILFLDVPSWVVVSIFPVSFLAIGFRFYVLIFRELAGEAPPPGEDPAAWELGGGPFGLEEGREVDPAGGAR